MCFRCCIPGVVCFSFSNIAVKEKCFFWLPSYSLLVSHPLLLLCFSSASPVFLLCLHCFSPDSPLLLLSPVFPLLLLYFLVSLLLLLSVSCVSSVLLCVSYFSSVFPASPQLLMCLSWFSSASPVLLICFSCGSPARQKNL